MTPRVFVGCSSEVAGTVASAIQMELASIATIQIWTQDFFAPGTYVLDVLAEEKDSFDFSIFIFSPDDVTTSRGKKYLTARDNTVLEAGFFLSHLGRKRTFIVGPSGSEMKWPSDLAGLTRIPYPKELDFDLMRAQLGPACTQMRRVIQSLGKHNHPLSDLSAGMIATLGYMSQHDSAPIREIAALTAAHSGESAVSGSGWKKAAMYQLMLLRHLNLIDESIGTNPTVTLSQRGRRITELGEFKTKLSEVLSRNHSSEFIEYFT